MAEIILDQSQVIAAIGEGEAAGMSEHVRVNMSQASTDAGLSDQIVHRLPGHRLLPFGDKQPRKPVVALPQPTSDRPQLVALDGMLDAESTFQPRNPKAGVCQIDVIPAKGNGFRDPQPVPEHHQGQQVITDAVPASLGGGKQAINLGQAQIVPPALMRIGGQIVITFDISPCGHGFVGSAKAKETSVSSSRPASTLYKMHFL